MFAFPQVSPNRARTIVRDIAAGSRPQSRFFVLLIASSMIASIGLIANSSAVIIGAMLVSPLMTPIFGASLGMLRGNSLMLLRSLVSEAFGAVLVVGSAYLIGLPHFTFDAATPEMLARTQPNVLDLLVAVFAGFAGSYAVVDERVSPALPGVAIATAIVPPLSTCGLCLALGAWSGAGGAMLLFVANFVSILFVSLLTFRFGGMGRAHRRTTRRILIQMVPTISAFVALAIVLTGALLRVAKENQLEKGVMSVLAEKLEAEHRADLISVKHNRVSDRIEVLATVRSDHIIRPAWVLDCKQLLEGSLGMPVDLVIRTIRSRDVSPPGELLQSVRRNMDGRLFSNFPQDDFAREILASQVIREAFAQEPGFELTRVEYGAVPNGGGLVLAYIDSIRRFDVQEIEYVETMLRERFDDPDLRFLVSVDVGTLDDRGGPIRLDWTNVEPADAQSVAQLPEIDAAVRSAVDQRLGLIPIHTHYNWENQRWRVLVELTGPRLVTQEDVREVESALPSDLRDRVEVLLFHRGDFIATGAGYTTYEKLTDPLIGQRRKKIHELFPATD